MSNGYVWRLKLLIRVLIFVSEQVELEATTNDPGTTLRAPTTEAGLAPACKDTCYGDLKLQIWERRYDGSKGKVHFCCACSHFQIIIHSLHRIKWFLLTPYF